MRKQKKVKIGKKSKQSIKPTQTIEDEKPILTIKDIPQENLVIVKVKHLEMHCIGCPNFKRVYLTEGIDEDAQVIMCDPPFKHPRIRSKIIEKPNCKKFAKEWHSDNWKPTTQRFFRKPTKKKGANPQFL